MTAPAKTMLAKLLISVISGAVLVAAFAPLEWVYLAFISVAALFFVCATVNPKQAFYLGLAFGYGQFGVGVSWVYVSMHTYGGMPLWMGAIAVLLFAGILALFTGLACYAAVRLFRADQSHRVFALAGFWLLAEWLRSWIFTGFAWLELGVSQTPTWLFALAPIGGVYLVSFSVAIIASCMVMIALRKSRLLAGTTIIVIVFSAWLSDQYKWSQNVGEPLHVGIVQANVPITQKWQAQYRDSVVGRLMSMSQELQQQSPLDLIVWPETALPLYYQQTDKLFWTSLIGTDTALLTGLVDQLGTDQVYNAAVLTCADEQKLYRKRHLVPFGEYLPMRFMLNWLLEFLQLPMSDFSSWDKPQALRCGEKINIGLSICYEDAFANESRQNVGDATVLVNISEDAWFGDSLAPHQRLQMGQMRARELSRPMVRSANSGPSAVINHLGEVLATTPQFEPAILAHQVQPQTGDTLYKLYGNWIIWLTIFLLVMRGILSARTQKNN